MKVALVHDYLNQYGGAERVLECFLDIFPDADVYTLLYDRSKLSDKLKEIKPVISFLQKLPLSKKLYERYLPFYPLAIEGFNLLDYDIVLSDSSAWTKGVFTHERALHICYCHNPMRFAYENFHDFTVGESRNKLEKGVLRLLINYFRMWDYSAAQRVDYFIAISQHIKRRIKKYYGRDSVVIYPPVDTDFFYPSERKKEDYFLVVGRFKEYKRFDIAIEAFNRLGIPLIVIGEGPLKGKLMRMARKNIHFTERVDDATLRAYYQNAQALVFTPLEDFGIVPLEAQACGTPVIAYNKGGARETVINGKTGIFFEEQTPESLIDAVKRFQGMKFKMEDMVLNARRFNRERFKKEIWEFVMEKYREFKNA